MGTYTKYITKLSKMFFEDFFHPSQYQTRRYPQQTRGRRYARHQPFDPFFGENFMFHRSPFKTRSDPFSDFREMRNHIPSDNSSDSGCPEHEQPTEIPIKLSTDENESNTRQEIADQIPEAINETLQENSQNSSENFSEDNEEGIENETREESLGKEETKSEDLETKNEKQEQKIQEEIRAKITDILIQSEKQISLISTATDTKQIYKTLRYCAENQYKLLETLDCMTIDKSFTDLRKMKKDAVKIISTRLELVDRTIVN